MHNNKRVILEYNEDNAKQLLMYYLKSASFHTGNNSKQVSETCITVEDC